MSHNAQRVEMADRSESSSAAVSVSEVEVETSDDINETLGRYFYSDIAKCLSTGAYSADADKATKGSIRKCSKFFVLEGGHLHYIGGKVKKSPRLVVHNEDER